MTDVDFDQFGKRRPGQGDKLRSRRGAIAQTWWSKRFLAAVESGGDRGRLSRGRTYARAGQVAELRPRKGAVTARVQGSRDRPYLVELGFRRWSATEVEAVVAVAVENPLLLAPLFAGDVPPAFVDLLNEVGVELLPPADDVTYDCSCPDDGEPCKHAAAVVYVLAERLDDEPATALQVRGVELGELLQRIQRAASGPSTGAEDLTVHVATFHRLTGDLPDLGVAPRLPGRTVADDLDDVVLGPGGGGVADTLRPYYAALHERSPRAGSRNADRA